MQAPIYSRAYTQAYITGAVILCNSFMLYYVIHGASAYIYLEALGFFAVGQFAVKNGKKPNRT